MVPNVADDLWIVMKMNLSAANASALRIGHEFVKVIVGGGEIAMVMRAVGGYIFFLEFH